MPDETRPATSPTVIEHSEKGALTGSAAIVNLTPSDKFVPPTMNLDGPPAVEPPAAEE